jgi:hypothetical protein
LDEAAAALVVEILSDPSNMVAIEAAAREIASETARLDLAIAEAEEVAEALADRLGRGELPLTRYNVAVRPLDERIKKLKDERAALPAHALQQPRRCAVDRSWHRPTACGRGAGPVGDDEVCPVQLAGFIVPDAEWPDLQAVVAVDCPGRMAG